MQHKRRLEQLCSGQASPSGAAAMDGGHHPPAEDEDEDEDDADALAACAPSDTEATIVLLRARLYPDPATAAAAAAAARRTPHAKRSRREAGPSKAEAAAATAAAAAAAAAAQLPPILLKSQLYTVLDDRTAADRDLEGLRRSGAARVFKLAIGADEYVVLLRSDYTAILNRLITHHKQLAAQHAQRERERELHAAQQQAQAQRQQQQQQPAGGQRQQRPAARAAAAPGSSDDGAGPQAGGSCAESAAIAATITRFRDCVVPAWHDATIARQQLLQLLRAPPPPASSAAAGALAPLAAGGAAAAGPAPQRGAPAPAPASDADIERHLLAAELLCRDGLSQGYVLTVPGAATFVRSVLAGRQEVLQALGRKRYQEALESELACLKFRNCCLTASFILRDLQGRGVLSITDSTAGRLVRKRKQ